ncbi:hypothetical protein AcV7_001728 [Taiwanofungus camphoratus]|nr:hypothetical protein AcV7_001728 [Antrodia cinnamomea]
MPSRGVIDDPWLAGLLSIYNPPNYCFARSLPSHTASRVGTAERINGGGRDGGGGGGGGDVSIEVTSQRVVGLAAAGKDVGPAAASGLASHRIGKTKAKATDTARLDRERHMPAPTSTMMPVRVCG